MGVDHGCLHILMSENFLDGPNIVTILQQVRSKRVWYAIPIPPKTPHSHKKQYALPGRAPPERASCDVLRRRFCRRWTLCYAYPGSIRTPPLDGCSVPQARVGVNALREAP